MQISCIISCNTQFIYKYICFSWDVGGTFGCVWSMKPTRWLGTLCPGKLKVDSSTPKYDPFVRGYHVPLCASFTILSFAKLAISIGHVACSNVGQHATVEVNSKLFSLSNKKPCFKLIGPQELMLEIWSNAQLYSKSTQILESNSRPSRHREALL